MSERFTPDTQEAPENFEAKRRVIEASTYAIQETSLLHKLGKGFEQSAIDAVSKELGAHEIPARMRVQDLRNTARDIVEGIAAELGFTQPEIMHDFDVSIGERLELSDRSAARVDGLDDAASRRTALLNGARLVLPDILKAHGVSPDFADAIDTQLQEALSVSTAEEEAELRQEMVRAIQFTLKELNVDSPGLTDDFREALEAEMRVDKHA